MPPSRSERPYSHRGLGSVSVPGTRAGGVVSVGLAIVAWAAIPLARPFILGASGLGLLLGLPALVETRPGLTAGVRQKKRLR